MNAENLTDFVLELSEREIYNDIRTECDIIDILTVRPDATPEFFDEFLTLSHQGRISSLAPGEVRELRLGPRDPDHIEIRWLRVDSVNQSPLSNYTLTQAQCEGFGGTWHNYPPHPAWCSLPSTLTYASAHIIERHERYCIVEVRADASNQFNIGVIVYVAYLALTPDKRFIKLRSHNDTSIRFYGRRVMDLVWPLGQHPTQMQSILDRYCQKYCMVHDDQPEPISTARVTIAGKNDELAQELLEYRIASHVSERGDYFAIPLIHPTLGLTELSEERWYVNSINVSDDVDRILEGTFELEQQRIMERPTLFKLSTSIEAADGSLLYDPATGIGTDILA